MRFRWRHSLFLLLGAAPLALLLALFAPERRVLIFGASVVAIAVGSSTQIALFVAPVLVFLSYLLGPSPMDLLFTGYEIVAITLAVLSIAFVAHDGETHWMDGVQLLAVYVILSLGFLFPSG